MELSKIKLPKQNISFMEDEHEYFVNGVKISSVSDIIEYCYIKTYGNDNNSQRYDTPKENGTIIHLAVELFLKTGLRTISDELSGYFNAFLKWYNDYKFKYKLIESEYKFFCKDLRYCGTIDLVLEDEFGRILVVDIKSTSAIHNKPLIMQLTGYTFALSNLGIGIAEPRVLQLKPDGTYIFEEKPYKLREFLAFLNVHNYIKN